MTASPTLIEPAEVALRILASRGTSAYLACLVRPEEAANVITEVEAELRALDEHVNIRSLVSSPGAARLFHELPSLLAEVVLIGAESYGEMDWRTVDRRRSALARDGVTVFFTTEPSFAVLMRVAPNLASWLAGLVFSSGNVDAIATERREQRLVSLRAWAGRTDAQVILAAAEGRLSRDPEYAEWLVLLGRGDLLDAR